MRATLDSVVDPVPSSVYGDYSDVSSLFKCTCNSVCTVMCLYIWFSTYIVHVHVHIYTNTVPQNGTCTYGISGYMYVPEALPLRRIVGDMQTVMFIYAFTQ